MPALQREVFPCLLAVPPEAVRTASCGAPRELPVLPSGGLPARAAEAHRTMSEGRRPAAARPRWRRRRRGRRRGGAPRRRWPRGRRSPPDLGATRRGAVRAGGDGGWADALHLLRPLLQSRPNRQAPADLRRPQECAAQGPGRAAHADVSQSLQRRGAAHRQRAVLHVPGEVRAKAEGDPGDASAGEEAEAVVEVASRARGLHRGLPRREGRRDLARPGDPVAPWEGAVSSLRPVLRGQRRRPPHPDLRQRRRPREAAALAGALAVRRAVAHALGARQQRLGVAVAAGAHQLRRSASALADDRPLASTTALEHQRWPSAECAAFSRRRGLPGGEVAAQLSGPIARDAQRQKRQRPSNAVALRATTAGALGDVGHHGGATEVPRPRLRLQPEWRRPRVDTEAAGWRSAHRLAAERDAVPLVEPGAGGRVGPGVARLRD
mmetsp:Transcript_56071/g.162400  ORF Transcript_56071/g.162400 Transcript_56071/m.162400 type:complete len:437 (+) Transcript_56071:236-1546(+)